MKLSFVSIELHNFKGIAGTFSWQYHQNPGFYFVRGTNKKEPRLGGNGAGKALSDDLVIDTPTGKMRWGDLKVGDLVFGSDGNPTRISGKFPQGDKPLYRVSFDDSTSTLCCEDHLWEVYCNKKGTLYGKHVLTTKELLENGITYPNGSALGARKWKVPRHHAVEFNNPTTPFINPYILGSWIGNGHKHNSRITINEKDTDVVKRLTEIAGKFTTKQAIGSTTVTLYGLSTYLNELGLCNLGSHERFIPDEYKTASIKDRLDLLNGLMDTDGYCSQNGKYSFSTTSHQLAEDVSWLVRSLGGKSYRIKEKDTFYRDISGDPISCRLAYIISFSLPSDMKPFFSKRKGSRVKETRQERYLERWISSIERESIGPCSCITVEAEDGLFLANDFIVTHNTTIMIDAPYWILTGKTVLSARPGSLVENWENNKVVGGSLLIELDGKRYRIIRQRNPSALMLNDETVAQEAIDKLLPLSDAALRRTLLLGQRSSLFLDLRPEDKSRLFSETLELDRWLEASDRAGECVRTLERKLHGVRAEITAAESLLNILRDQHDEAADKEESFGADKTNRLATIGTQRNQTRTELEEVREALSEARRAFTSLEVSPDPKAQSLTQRLADFRQQEGTSKSTLGRTEGNLRTVRQEEQKTRALIAQYEESPLCPECGQTVTAEHTKEKLAELTEKAKDLTQLGDNLARQANDLSMRLLGYTDDIRELEKKLEQTREIRHEVDLLEIKEVNLSRHLDSLNTGWEGIKNEPNPFTALCNDLERKYDETSRSIEGMKEEETKLNQDVEIHKFWQKGFKDIRLQLIDQTLIELQLTTKRNAEALGLEGWDIEFLTERETKSGSTSQSFTVLLYPPGQREPIDWAAFSGGEAQRWHIAVTCGLSEVLLSRAGIEPDIEVYDEITNYISSEGIDDVMEFLRERAIELNRKIYLIDHHIGVGDFTDTVDIIKDETGIKIQETANV